MKENLVFNEIWQVKIEQAIFSRQLLFARNSLKVRNKSHAIPFENNTIPMPQQ